MNTILQKRIEEAAVAIAPFNRMSQKRDYFVKGCEWMLKNQWISVDEALPEDKTKVFVIVKTPVGIVHRADYHINDYWYMSRYSPEEIVTHWMPIPQLKGGKE